MFPHRQLLLASALALLASTQADDPRITFYLNAEECEETTFNQWATRSANSDDCAALSLDHVSLNCSGTNGDATLDFWGLFNTDCSDRQNDPLREVKLHPGCNRRIGGTLYSAYLKGCDGETSGEADQYDDDAEADFRARGLDRDGIHRSDNNRDRDEERDSNRDDRPRTRHNDTRGSEEDSSEDRHRHRDHDDRANRPGGRKLLRRD